MKFQLTEKEQKSLSLTVYQNGFGMIKDVRRIVSTEEVDEVQLMDTAKNLDVDSIIIKGIQVLEQSYSQNAWNKDKLLERYLGQVVTVRNSDTGESMQIRLLNVTDGLIGERMDTGELAIDPIGELLLPPLPEGLSAKPAIVWKVPAGKIDAEVQVLYITEGLEWRAIYIAEIEGTALRLSGSMEIRNSTGTDFLNAKIKLVAGEINRGIKPMGLSAEAALYKSSAILPQVEERHFVDHPAYKITRNITILDGQTKQIAFLEAQVVSYRTVYEVNKWSERALVKVEFANTKANGLGLSMPRGTAKVYRLDEEREVEFVGEDAVGNLPVEATMSIAIGEAFDIRCKSFEKKRWKQEGIEYTTHIYELTNGKEENVRIHIHHSIEEALWEMESSSHDYEIKNANKIEFIIRATAKKAAIVEFTYKMDKR